VTAIVEHNGQCWEIEFGPGCDDCFGLGAVFVHTHSCDSDFCVGNGDQYACSGSWLPCDSCGTMESVA
jgi:hypothetical protein